MKRIVCICSKDEAELTSVKPTVYGNRKRSDDIGVNAGWARHIVATLPDRYWTQKARENGLFLVCWKEVETSLGRGRRQWMWMVFLDTGGRSWSTQSEWKWIEIR